MGLYDGKGALECCYGREAIQKHFVATTVLHKSTGKLTLKDVTVFQVYDWLLLPDERNEIKLITNSILQGVKSGPEIDEKASSSSCVKVAKAQAKLAAKDKEKKKSIQSYFK